MIYAVKVMCNNYNERWKDVRMKFKFSIAKKANTHEEFSLVISISYINHSSHISS